MNDHINRAEIKRRRLARKFSLRQAANLAGMHDMYPAQRWKKIEDGTGDLETKTLIRVAKALGCQIGDLVNGEK